jgi:hypothetical protein
MTNGWQQNTDGRFIFLPTHARSSSLFRAADYAQTMRVRGPIQTKTSNSSKKSLPMFSVSYRLAWYGVENEIALIT